MFLKKLRVAGLATMMVLAASTSVFAAGAQEEQEILSKPTNELMEGDSSQNL